MEKVSNAPALTLATPEQHEEDVAQVQNLFEKIQELKSEVGRRIVGQDEVVEMLLLTLFAGGHSLLIGAVLAKTLLIQTLSEAMALDFARIQFTPDLMPSDIAGDRATSEDTQSRSRTFEFVKGPIFANVLLADEVNRTPPKTQAALLQAMQEREVTSAGETHALPTPFLVFATQNPIEQEGTYVLPEAQLDRFMFMIHVGYPSADEEVRIVQTTTSQHEATISPVISQDDILQFQSLVRRMPAWRRTRCSLCCQLSEGHSARPRQSLRAAQKNSVGRWTPGQPEFDFSCQSEGGFRGGVMQRALLTSSMWRALF